MHYKPRPNCQNLVGTETDPDAVRGRAWSHEVSGLTLEKQLLIYTFVYTRYGGFHCMSF